MQRATQPIGPRHDVESRLEARAGAREGPRYLTTLLIHMLPSVGDSEHSFSVLSGSVFFPSETMVCSEFFKAMFQIVSEVCVNIQKEGSR